jgi:hypothetical protein
VNRKPTYAELEAENLKLRAALQEYIERGSWSPLDPQTIRARKTLTEGQILRNKRRAGKKAASKGNSKPGRVGTTKRYTRRVAC